MSTTTLTQVNITTQKVDVEAEYTALANGMSTDLPDITSFLMAHTTYAKDDLVTRFKAFLAAIEATKSARTALHLAVANERALLKQVAPLRAQLKTYLGLRFGKNSPEMQKFGFTQAKVPKTPVASKAEGIVKNKATRAVRGTASKKQKSKIKAPAVTAPAVAATPVAPATASASSPTASPAASAATAPARPGS
jgi:hypothetical protein